MEALISKGKKTQVYVKKDKPIIFKYSELGDIYLRTCTHITQYNEGILI